MKQVFVVLFISMATFCLGQRFGAGMQMGINLAQIDGDGIYGFNKFGANGGIFATTKFGKISEMLVQFLYSGRGSHSKQDDRVRINYRLHYIEIPLVYTFKDWAGVDRDHEYYKMHFHGGLSYGRLISSSSLNNWDENFKKNDLSWLAGFTYYYSYNLGVSGRYTRSIIPLYRFIENNTEMKMISYFISLGLVYNFK